jgi:hypothetical protein
MFPPRTAIRSIVACTLACGLLATTTSSAAARPVDDRGDVPTSSLAGTTSETPRQDLRSPDARDAARPITQDLRTPDARDAANAEQIARSMEDYYQSFGEPVPVAPFASSEPASPPPADETPWLLVSAIAAALAGVLASAALVLRRRHTTRVAA